MAETQNTTTATVKAQRKSLRNVHFAILTKDDSTGATYQTPEKLVGAITATVTPSTNTEKLYADDGVFDVCSNLGDITVEMALAALPLSVQAKLLGHTYANGVMVKKASDEAPYVAIGFMSEPQPGKYYCTWLYKGKFNLVTSEFGTKADSPEYRQPSLTATFIKREYDDAWQVEADTSDSTFSGVTTFFDSVYAVASSGT